MFEKRIGITQRVIKNPIYNEEMDCLDTQWTALLTSLRFLPIPLPTLPPSQVSAQWESLQLDGLILSGGNTLTAFADENDAPATLSPARDVFELEVLKRAIGNNVPVLGVCRGLQLINHYYGGRLVKVKGHAGQGRHFLLAGAKDKLFVCPSDVNSYHDCAIPSDGLGENLIPLAYDEDGHIEAFRHDQNTILAIMWHPERENPPLLNDCNLIKRYFKQ